MMKQMKYKTGSWMLIAMLFLPMTPVQAATMEEKMPVLLSETAEEGESSSYSGVEIYDDPVTMYARNDGVILFKDIDETAGKIESLSKLKKDTKVKVLGKGLFQYEQIYIVEYNSKRGFMYTGGSLEYINNLNIVEVLRNRTGIPVTVENDAKCAAVAEVWKGALKDCENAVVIVCGTAIGGAVIRNREVISGKHFMAGEFSYIMTDSKEEYKRSNCLADTAGAAALLARVSEETGIPVEELTGEKAFSMANQGNERAIKGIRRHAKKLAVQVHNYQYMFDPERIAIGGGISEQPLLLQLVKEELAKINAIFPWTLPMPDVTTCQFYNDANLIGAVYIHIKAQEKTISMEKVNELMELLEDRREGEYLKALLME